jgi:hypothetical protein
MSERLQAAVVLLLTAICASEHQGPGKVPGGAPYALMSDQFAQQRTHACQSVYRLPWSKCCGCARTR